MNEIVIFLGGFLFFMSYVNSTSRFPWTRTSQSAGPYSNAYPPQRVWGSNPSNGILCTVIVLDLQPFLLSFHLSELSVHCPLTLNKYVIRMLLTEHSIANVAITAGDWKQWNSRTLTYNFEGKKIYNLKNLFFKGLLRNMRRMSFWKEKQELAH